MANKKRAHSSADTGAVRKVVVKSVNWRGHLKRLSFGGNANYLDVPRSACVTKGDTVIVRGKVAHVQGRDTLIQIAPTYIREETLSAGGLQVSVLIKEITSEDEHESSQALAKYHYRDQPLFGRTAKLIARTFHPAFPRILGYIELATPFYMNKPRAAILDAPFRNGTVGWEHWDMAAQREFIHGIVRIARCVIHPEFRGLGLGPVLVRHAATFARGRWQVRGIRPYFIEISADMLKYVPFAERAGLHFIGETEGNLGRVAKDMRYLMGNAEKVRKGEIVKEDSCGIVDTQVARMERALKLEAECEDLSRDELLHRLARLSKEEVLRDYALFHDIVSLPKPTYMMGLNGQAEAFVRRRVKEVAPKNGWAPPPLPINRMAAPIELDGLSLTYSSRVRRTKQTHAVQQAFGISPDDVDTAVLRDLSLQISPGEIVLITGPSGSGKTTLLNVLARLPNQRGLRQEGEVSFPKDYDPGLFEPFRSRKALVERFAAPDACGSVHGALHLMGCVGLSDAFVFLKRFSELSKGQQYRAMLADLIARRANAWLVDEFCANLDTVTANVVADRLQKMARRLGATLVVAAPHCELFLHALKPDKVVLLTSAGEPAIWEGATFMSHLDRPCHWREQLRRLPLHADAFAAAYQGARMLIVPKKRRTIQSGPLLLVYDDDRLLVNVTSVEHRSVENLTERHAEQAAYADLDALRAGLHRTFPSLKKGASLALIEFELA